MTSPIESLVSQMTIAELATRSGKSVSDIIALAMATKQKPATVAKGPTAAEVNTRTPAGREAYDAAVLVTLESAGKPMQATDLRAAVGGTGLQARAALNRLIDAGQVSYKGVARSMRYSAV